MKWTSNKERMKKNEYTQNVCIYGDRWLYHSVFISIFILQLFHFIRYVFIIIIISGRRIGIFFSSLSSVGGSLGKFILNNRKNHCCCWWCFFNENFKQDLFVWSEFYFGGGEFWNYSDDDNQIQISICWIEFWMKSENFSCSFI